MKNWLQNGTVILTGASSGIGKELCKLLLERYSAKVIGVGRREEKMLSLIEELSEKAKENFSYQLFDVGERSGWEKLKKTLDEQGVVPRLIINNAGVFPAFSKAKTQCGGEVEKTLRINFLSAVYAAECFLPEGDGKEPFGILNISSSAALCPVAGTAAYSASKSALQGFTRALALEKKKGVYIGIAYPGTTATELFSGNEALTKSNLFERFAMRPKTMAEKIAKTALKKKRSAVLGIDAKLMNFLSKLAPVKGPALVCGIMRKFGGKYFNDLFKKDE